MKGKKIAALLLGMAMMVGSLPAMVMGDENKGDDANVPYEESQENDGTSNEEPPAPDEQPDNDNSGEQENEETDNTPQSKSVDYGAVIVSDQYGGDPNITWILYESGTLVISGSGPMKNYEKYNNDDFRNLDYNLLITNVIIEEGITSVGALAFARYCPYIKTVSIPASVETIEKNAFEYCTELASVTFEDNCSLTSIKFAAFNCCTSLSSITIPESVETIEQSALGSTGLTTVTFEGNSKITSIEKQVFAGCTKLTSISIPSGVTCIGDSAFYKCKSLNSIFISNDVESIGDSAFYQTGISSVTFEENSSLTAISPNAFYKCANLESVIIPESVEVIDFNAFRDCTSLTTVTFEGNKVNNIGSSAFRNCSSLKSFTIPNGIRYIEGYCFYESGLTEVVLEENSNLVNIGVFAFANTNIRSFTVPEKVIQIGTECFSSDSFEECHVLADPSTMSLNWYNGGYWFDSSKPVKVYVPGNYIEGYRNLFDSETYPNFQVLDESEMQINTGNGIHLYGHSLSLSGDIGVNFYMELDDAVAASSDAYMMFTVPNGNKTETQIVYVNPQADAGLAYAKNEGGYYVFKCRVSAKDTTSVITAQMYVNGEAAGEAYTYSVQEYARYILLNSSKYTDKTVSLVKALLNYGAAAQTYFNVRTDKLANNIACMSDDDRSVASVAVNEISAPAAIIPNLPEDVTFAGATVSLKSETTLNLYFSSSQDLTFSGSGYTVDYEKTSKYQIARIRGIKASDLNKPITINVTCGGSAYQIQYSVLNYCANALDGTHQDLEPIITALYRYYEAAKNYVGGN